MSWQEELRAKRAATERWINQKNAEVRRVAAEAEARGRQVYADTIRTGQQVWARTPSEVRRLGVAAVQGRLPQALAEEAIRQVRGQPPGPQRTKTAAPAAKPKPKIDASRELQAGVSGFVDEASFGAADHILAAGDAVKAAIADRNIDGLVGDYGRSMDEKRASDAYDDKHHAVSRNTGRVLGFAATVAPLGAPAVGRAMLMFGPRAARTARAMSSGSRYGLNTKGLTEMAAVTGASAGVLEQAATDTLTGRQATAGDYLRAGASGALGGVGTRWVGPIVGGSVGGASSSVIDDALAGREISVGDMIGAAHGGGMLGGIGGALGTYHIATRSPKAKGEVGEMLTRTKVVARGDGPVRGANERLDLDEGGYTVTDARGGGDGAPLKIFESKMGPGASKTRRQRQAEDQFGDNYYTDGWRFSDVGKAQGLAAAPLGYQAWDRSRGEPRRR